MSSVEDSLVPRPPPYNPDYIPDNSTSTYEFIPSAPPGQQEQTSPQINHHGEYQTTNDDNKSNNRSSFIESIVSTAKKIDEKHHIVENSKTAAKVTAKHSKKLAISAFKETKKIIKTAKSKT